ncbi:hypothetical protein [Streptomyces sp. NPDC002537]
MNSTGRRIAAIAVLLLGIALGAWVVFGAPHEWDGDMKLLRLVLGLSVLGLVSVSAKLMFPERSERS